MDAAAVHFVTRFLLPVSIMMSAMVLTVSGILFWLTAQQDTMEMQREEQAVRFGLQAQVSRMQDLVTEFSVWSDAVTNIAIKFDETWIDDNYGLYVWETYGFDYVFIVDGAGKSVYGSVEGQQRRGLNPEGFLGPGYAKVLNATIASPAKARAGISIGEHGPMLFSLNALQPSDERVRVPDGKQYFVAMARLIDQDFLEQVSQSAAGVQVRLAKGSAPSQVGIPLTSEAGRPIGVLTWTPNRPGSDFLRDFGLWIGIILAAVLALGTLVILHARRASRQIIGNARQARHLARTDMLTGLPNRRAFNEYLLQTSDRPDSYTIVYMDLDGFKEVNDTYGHGTGDALLRRTSERLLGVKPEDAFLARLGGDEFAIVTTNHDRAACEKLADRIILALREQHHMGGEPVVVGVSIGIAVSGDDDYETVVRHADIAMYAAKSRGRDGWCVYQSSLDCGRRERKQLEAELRKAITNGDIDLVFQPIVRSRDGSVTAVEALARWTHPTRGAISPDIFIPVAEETGAIIELGQFVLRKACRAARDWPFKLAVNLSPAQFWDRMLVDSVLSTLAECDFPPERLEFEITETYLLRRPEAAAEVIAGLRSHGIKIALDDFGTGYASIGYLKRFNFDLVKLDRSFVENIAHQPEAAEVAHAMIALGGALKLPILAEGVETAAQSEILSLAGCSYMQGWHYGYPVAAEQIDAQLAPDKTNVAA